MDKFVEEAFKQADNAISKTAGVVFNTIYEKDRNNILKVVASLMGEEDYAELMNGVKAKGLEGNLRQFEYVIMAAGFWKGFRAGRMSMLEDMSNV